MKFFFLCIFLFHTVLSYEEIDLISDVISSYHQPTSVLARVCWNTAKKRKLLQNLYKTSPPKAVQFIETAHDIKLAYQKETVILADVKCPETREFCRLANITQKFRSPYRWIIIDLENKQTIIPYELEDLNVLVDSDVIITNKNNKSYTLLKPYKCASNSSWSIETFGTWTFRQGLKKFSEMSIPTSRRRRNLKGTPIGTSMVINDNNTKNELTSLRNLKSDYLSKGGYQQMLPLYYFMNATMVIVFTDDWGYFKNGSYNGMISDILQGTAELTGTVIFLTKPRLSILDYLSFPLQSTVRFVFRQPSLSYQNNLFVLPFKPTVWLCIFCLIFVLLLITFINLRWENFKNRNIDNPSHPTNLDMSEMVMMIISAVTQQGSYSEFKGTLGRVVMFLMFFVFLFLHTSYSANIVALLQSSSTDIKTLSDLLNSRLELGAEDTQYNRQLLSTANESIRKAIYEKKIAPPGYKANFMSLEEGVKRMQTKPFAFHMYLGLGYRLVEKYFQEHEKCGLQEIQFNFETTPWIACRKNSPYKEIFKIGLLRNQEHGINNRVTRLIYSRRPICSAHGGSFDSVNMIDFYPALLLLAYGMIVSVLFLCMEYLVWLRFSK